jgi:predicted ATPase/DNA-binding CsgD family transcriptional regulator
MDTLPLHLTSFVGRERECAEIAQLVETTRLLTLVGTGGVGKTRLALEVARTLQPEFAHGVWLVELAALADPALVLQAISTSLGVAEIAGQPLEETLLHVLSSRRPLLVLDNCEHVLPACADVVDRLLRSCAQVHILATSRQPLRVAGETVWRVPSLSAPDLGVASGTDEIAAAESVRLFVERSRSALPRFALTDTNAPDVAQICRRLDGIPLAIERAAARVSSLGVHQLTARLDDRFHLLTRGSRTAAQRHQTLRSAIDWSFELLSEDERTVFRRVSVFAGGWTLEAAQAVCSDKSLDAPAILDVLAELVDRSLVVAQGQEAEVRYELLETLRQYAHERLQVAGEVAQLRDRHAAWCLSDVAEPTQRMLSGPDQVAWLDHLERELDNVRVALGWLRESDPLTGLRIAGGLSRFWVNRGYFAEGRQWLEGLLDRAPGRSAAQAKALGAAGELAMRQGALTQASSHLQEALAVYRELGDQAGVATCLERLGLALALQGDSSSGGARMREALDVFQAIADQPGVGWTRVTLGMFSRTVGDLDAATEFLQAGLTDLRAIGDQYGIAHALNNLGQLARVRGDFERAAVLLEESLSLFRGGLDSGQLAWTLNCVGNVARLRGDAQRAAETLRESVAIAAALGAARQTYHSLAFLGMLAAQQAGWTSSVRLISSAASYASHDPGRSSLDEDEKRDWDTSLAAARSALDEKTFDEAWLTGQTMSIDDALAEADQLLTVHPVPDIGLSRREQEVVRLIAQGLSNREIADALVIAGRTAEAHVTHVLAKLGLRSRSQVAIWALEHGL